MWGYYCQRCGHRWVPKWLGAAYRAKGEKVRILANDPGPAPTEAEPDPRVCPACKSPYWNRPKAGG
jgi:hypothetical protein